MAKDYDSNAGKYIHPTQVETYGSLLEQLDPGDTAILRSEMTKKKMPGSFMSLIGQLPVAQGSKVAQMSPKELTKPLSQAYPETFKKLHGGGVTRENIFASIVPNPEQDLVNKSFVQDLTNAYYSNYGDIPMQFYIDNQQDLHLLGPDMAGAVRAAYNHDADIAQYNELKTDIATSRKATEERVASIYGVTEERAAAILQGYQDYSGNVEEKLSVLDNVDQALAYVTRKHNFYAKGYISRYESGETSAEEVIALAKSQMRRELMNSATEDLLTEQEIKAGPKSGLVGSFLSGTVLDKPSLASDLGLVLRGGSDTLSSKLYDDGITVLGAVMSPIQDAIGGLAWLETHVLTDALRVPEDKVKAGVAGFNEWYGDTFSWTRAQQDREAERTENERLRGMDDDTLLREIASGDVAYVMQAMQIEDPDRYEELLQIYGSDAEAYAALKDIAAFGVSPDGFSNNSTSAQERQLRLDNYRADVDHRLQDLRDGNFTIGQAAMNVISLWGEGVESVAATATLFTAISLDPIFDKQEIKGFQDFWTRVGEGDNPSGVMGLDGTLIGLGLDLGLGAVFDPFTWIFAPKLGAAGRHGVTTEAQILETLNTPAAKQVRREIITLRRGGNNRATAAVLNNLGVEDGSRYLAIVDGFESPMPINANMDPAFVGTTRRVSIRSLDAGIAPDNLLTQQQLVDRVVDMRMRGQTKPVVIRVNPKTGHWGVSDGLDQLAAANLIGFDDIDAVAHLDEFYGITERVPVNPDSWGKFNTLDDFDRVQTLASGETPRGISLSGNEVNEGVLGQVLKWQKDPAILELSDDIATHQLSKGGEQLIIKRLSGGPETGIINYVAVIDGKPVGQFYLSPKGIPKKSSVKIGITAEARGAATLLRDGRSIIDTLYDTARQIDGIEPLSMAANSDNVSASALRSAQRQAKRSLDMVLPEAGAGSGGVNALGAQFTERQAVTQAEWGIGAQAERATEIGGKLYLSPDIAMPDALRWGKEVDVEALMGIERRSLQLGNDPLSGRNLAMNISFGRATAEAVLKFAKGGEHSLKEFMTVMNNSVLVPLRSQMSMTHINNLFSSMYGSVNDVIGLESVFNRTNAFWTKQGHLRIKGDLYRAQLRDLYTTRTALEATTGKHVAQQAGAKVDDVTRAAAEQARAEIRIVEARIEEIKGLQQEYLRDVNDMTELDTIIREELDNYNRTHIASRPAWKEFVDEDGLVPWHHISNRQINPEAMFNRALLRVKNESISFREAMLTELGGKSSPKFVREIIDSVDEAMAKDFARFEKEALHSSVGPSSASLPATPLEIIAATHMNRVQVAKLHGWMASGKIRSGLHNLQMAWMIDKVLTPRTGIVVSGDEMMRIMHQGGVKTPFEYFGDKFVNTANRVATIRGSAGFERLPQAWKDRILALQEAPQWFEDVQRSLLETHGNGMDTIKFKKGSRVANNDYYAAAQRKAQETLRHSGWQAYFQGPESFKEWFLTHEDALAFRESEYVSLPTFAQAGLPGWEDAYNGLKSTFENYYMKEIPAAKRAAAVEQWAKRASEAAARGSKGAPTALPDWLLEGFGEIVGRTKVPRNGILKPIDYLSERVFQKPMDYRKGFLAESVRNAEWTRLNKLYDDLGVTVMGHEEYMGMMRRKYPNLPDNLFIFHEQRLMSELLEQERVVSAQFIHELVEKKVVQEMEDTLYATHMSSSLGKKAKAIWPFGKPWADMWGHWGKAAFSKPQLRGILNKDNYFGMPNILRKAAEYAPVNLKTAGYISRIAATDFNMDNIQDDPLFGGVADWLGVESLDVGNALFLPHGGESPFLVMLPGVGIFAAPFLEHWIHSAAPDSNVDPVGYSNFMNQWADVIMGMGYNKPESVAAAGSELLFGGGLLSRSIGLMDRMALMANISTPLTQDSITGAWRTQMAYDRQIKVALSDPAFYDQMMDIPADMADMTLQAWINSELQKVQDEAMTQVGWQRLKEDVMEFMAPANVVTLTQADDLADVWIDNAETIGVPAGIRARFDLSTSTGRDLAAGSIRKYFFQDLPQNERDAYVAANPGLAVNMVSMWTWSDKAVGQQITGAGMPYSSGGSTTDVDRHRALIEQGYIRPITPRELMTRIIGTVASARANAAAALYEDAAEQVNQQRWEWIVPEAIKQYVEDWRVWVADEVPWETTQDAWRHFSDIQEAAWQKEGRPLNKDGKPDLIKLKDKYAPWGASLPSSSEGLREAYREGYEIPFITDEMRLLAKATGIELGEGTEMATLAQDVFDYRAKNYTDNPVAVQVLPEYGVYLRPRSEARASTLKVINAQLASSKIDPDFKYRTQQTLMFIEDALARKSRGDVGWREVRDKAAEMYHSLDEDAVLGLLDLKGLWNQAWGNALGDHDWLPDEPAPLDFSANTDLIYPLEVYDGDTIQYSYDVGRRLFGAVGPRLGPAAHSVRLLGLNAREIGEDGGEEDKKLLQDAIESALANDVPIYIQMDPARYGQTDYYGRAFGWLYIGDEAFERPETQIPRRYLNG